MKAGDLVKRRGENWIGLVLKMCNSNGYTYPEFVWLDEWATGSFEIEVAGKRFSAAASLRPMYDPTGRKIKC